MAFAIIAVPTKCRGASFDAVEAARGDVALSYFELTILVIMHLFAAAQLYVAILEVGLDGQLDAVNVIDPDVTSVDIDHTDYLGDKCKRVIALGS